MVKVCASMKPQLRAQPTQSFSYKGAKLLEGSSLLEVKKRHSKGNFKFSFMLGYFLLPSN